MPAGTSQTGVSGGRAGGSRHPPFHAGPVTVDDRETETDRAHRLARIIREAWAKCGHDIEVRVVSHAGHPVVRIPGLINGLPARVVIEG